MKTLLALGALGGIGLSAGQAAAQDHSRQCVTWRHGQCVDWAARHDRWHVGRVLGADYGYSDYASLPRRDVLRYHLSARDRYVASGDRIYVVDRDTYAVTRILNAVPR